MKLFTLLEKLTERKIWYSFQSQSNDYYHLIIVNPQGIKKIKGYHSIKELEKWLVRMWGHLIVPMPPPPGV